MSEATEALWLANVFIQGGRIYFLFDRRPLQGGFLFY